MIPMNGIDALCLAVFLYESGFAKDPTVPAIKNNNPGNLRSPGWKVHDLKGYDVYPDFETGFGHLYDDLQDKLSGHNSHGLGQTSTVAELFKIYAPAEDANDPASYAAFAAGYVQRALGRTVTVQSPLSAIWSPSQS
jgi:hypothetical protein